MGTLLQKIDRERTLEKVNDAVEAAKMCRIHLSKDAPRPVELSWCQGRGFQRSLIILNPGKSIDQPLDKTRAWFGPFDLFKVYEETRDERKLDDLRDIISTESARYLMRYDYPRTAGVKTKTLDVTPTGPHRSPDVTITIMNADGTTEAPVRLHEIYGVGEFDEEFPIDSFERKETEEEIKERFEAQLREKDESHRAEIEEFNRKLAEVAGLVKGRLFTLDEKQPIEAGA